MGILKNEFAVFDKSWVVTDVKEANGNFNICIKPYHEEYKKPITGDVFVMVADLMGDMEKTIKKG